MAQDATLGGPYVGAQMGWGQRSTDFDLEDMGGDDDFDVSRDGLDYGVFAGYDMPLGTNFLVGVEGGIGFGGKTLHASPSADIETSINPKWNWDVSARAGFLASPNLLVYGRAGYGAERVKTSLVSTDPAVPDLSDTSWSDGLLYGGGVEYGLNEAASIRAEYRHRDMDGGYA